jgi:hypothetical protein
MGVLGEVVVAPLVAVAVGESIGTTSVCGAFVLSVVFFVSYGGGLGWLVVDVAI